MNNNNNELRPTLKVQTGEDGNPKVYAQGTPPPRNRRPLRGSGCRSLHRTLRSGGSSHQHNDGRRKPHGSDGGTP